MKQKEFALIVLSIIIGVFLLVYGIVNQEGIIKWAWVMVLICLLISSGILCYSWLKRVD